jgi:hypothetical protein
MIEALAVEQRNPSGLAGRLGRIRQSGKSREKQSEADE